MQIRVQQRKRRGRPQPVDVSLLIAYLRVSTEEQARTGLGLDAQRLAIQAWAQMHGKTIVRWVIDEGQSGGDLNREHFPEVLEHIANGEAAGVVVSKLDRLSRSLFDFASLMKQSRDEGWQIVALDVGLDTSTPTGELMAGILALFAQWERRVIIQRTKDALAVKKSQGVVLGRPRQITDETLEEVARLYAGCLTYFHTAAQLNDAGVPTARGTGKWHPDTVRKLLLNTPYGQAALDEALQLRDRARTKARGRRNTQKQKVTA